MHLRLGGVWPLSSTKTREPKREFAFGMPTRSQLTPDSQLSMLKTVYQKADEKTVEKTYTSVQQSLATMTTHLGSTLNTRSDHPDNREGAETCQRPEDIDFEEVSIDFLRAYSVHPDWKQIISSCNDYGQTMAHITVTLGYLRLLRRLCTWEIDLNVVDNLGLTALHYAYLFKQGDCAKFLIQSGVNQFILDDLGRSPSDLEPSLEVSLHSIMGIDSDSHAVSTSPIEYNTEMPDKVRKVSEKHNLVQQWIQGDEDERRGEMPSSRCQSPEILDRPSKASSPPDVPNYPFPSLGVPSPGENSTFTVVKEEMDLEAAIEMAAPPDIVLALSPISGASILSQEADRPSDIGQNTLSHPAPSDGVITTSRKTGNPKEGPETLETLFSAPSTPTTPFHTTQLSFASLLMCETLPPTQDTRQPSEVVRHLEPFVSHQAQLGRDPYSVPVEVMTANTSDTAGPSSPSRALPRGGTLSNRRKASLNAIIPPAKRSRRVLQSNITGNTGTQVGSTDESLGFESLEDQPEVQKAMRALVTAIRTSPFFINNQIEPNLGTYEAGHLTAVAPHELWRDYGTKCKSIYSIFIKVDGNECKCLWCGEVQKGKLEHAVGHFRAKHMVHQPFFCGDIHVGNDVW